ncbi:Hypothetical protein NGAL_HAMBI1146_15880 [Neorhizobium galegae bv. officinalis]|nr:Hypothetical protein NGAL_HAMBI1146_15880 [Neorhizobium galegae bv. officinalis]
MIFVAGASGTGKTTVLERFVSCHPEFIHLKASMILRDLGRPLLDLSKAQLLENQKALQGYLRSVSITSTTILDGHMTIPVGEALFDVPSSFLEGIPLSGMLFMQTNPQEILVRKGSFLTSQALDQLKRLQFAEYEHMKKVAAERDCRFRSLDTANYAEVEEALLQYSAL